ncbi:methyltransferase domain-containing protein [Salinifilum aidingensis]
MLCMVEHAHSHDNIDWDARLADLRQVDELVAPETRQLVASLLRAEDRRVVEIGAGAGGTAAAFAAELGRRDPGGAGVVVVDSAPQLLAEATRRARCSVSADVEVRGVRADAAGPELAEAVGEQVDLVHAAFAVHHLPDQVAGLRRLAGLARPGGRVAIVETGLPPRVLPWDVGLGEPGLEERLTATDDEWFRRMRAEMEGAVRLPVGWGSAMREAGLQDVETRSYLVDRPAPLDENVRGAVVGRLAHLQRHAAERVGAEDAAVLERLLDPDDPHYAGNREDLYYLAAHSVIVGTVPE